MTKASLNPPIFQTSPSPREGDACKRSAAHRGCPGTMGKMPPVTATTHYRNNRPLSRSAGEG